MPSKQPQVGDKCASRWQAENLQSRWGIPGRIARKRFGTVEALKPTTSGENWSQRGRYFQFQYFHLFSNAITLAPVTL